MISRTCNSRPKIEANPAMPPNNPYPNSRPNRPAPRKPAARPPSSPRPPNKPALGAVRASPTLEGCVIERWIGAAVGAVAVLGGAEYVRVPRLPAEKPSKRPCLGFRGNKYKSGRDRNKCGQHAVAKHGIDLPAK